MVEKEKIKTIALKSELSAGDIYFLLSLEDPDEIKFLGEIA